MHCRFFALVSAYVILCFFGFNQAVQADTISGSILATDLSQVGGAVRVYDSAGNEQNSFSVDRNGNWTAEGLAPDTTYYLTTGYTWADVVDGVWDGAQGAACPNLTCDITTFTPVSFSAGNPVSGIDFRLGPIVSGGRISGNLSDGVNPINYASLFYLNDQGRYLGEVRTDPAGNFTTPMLADGNFYIHTRWEPNGLGRELWAGGEPGNILCNPKGLCNDPAFIMTNGTPVSVSGTDTGGFDFILDDLGAGRITGNVFDQVLADAAVAFSLPDVYLVLYSASGEGLEDAISDESGNFTFAGLADGDYRVFAGGVPEGYATECFGNVSCDGGTDFSSVGAIVTVSSGSTELADIGLDFSGTRIVGTVTRTGGDPVSSYFGWMGIQLFNDAGNGIDTRATNVAGQYQIPLGDPMDPSPQSFYLATTMDQEFHGLVNEVWDGVQCFDGCYPPTVVGAPNVTVNDGDTFVADFVLDSGRAISGTVTALDTGAVLGDIEVCVERLADGWWADCNRTDGNGDYALTGLEARDDYRVFVNNTNGQPYQTQDYPANPVDVTAGDASGINFALNAGYVITGTILDATTSNPIAGVGVCIHYTWGDWAGVCGGTDANGFYQTNPALPAGGDYVAYAIPEEQGYRRQMFDGLDCPNNYCDFSTGTPITLGPGDANGVNFNLNPAASITGAISDSNGLLTNGNGRARIYDSNGQLIDQVFTDENGIFRAGGLEPGTFYVLGAGRDSNLIDELWNGAGNPGVHCPRLSCGIAAGTPIVISGSETVVADVVLDPGSRLTGTITVDGSTPGSADIFFYDGDGDYAGFAFTDGAGNYQSFSGFPAGTWYASNRFVVSGAEQNIQLEFMPTMYLDTNQDGIGCGFPCDVAGTVASASGVTTDGSTDSGLNNYNYVTQPSASISGTLLANDGSEVGGAVHVLDASGNYVTDAWVQDQSGNWNTGPLGAGTYILVTRYTWAEVIDDAWDGIDGSQCFNLTCDFLATTPVVIQGGVPVTGIDFRLDAFTGGGRINGTLTDEAGNPLFYVDVEVMNRNGDFLRGVRTDANGFFETPLLANDDYYLRTSREPDGRSREVFVWPGDTLAAPDTNYTCPSAQDCWDPNVVTTNGSPVNIADGDFIGLDFVLKVPATGGQISGTVYDQGAGIGFALPDVNIVLFDSAGNWIIDTQTEPDGSYTFAGLPDGDYQVFTGGTPEGYAQECYLDVPCDWGTDFGASGATLLTISGGNVVSNVDIGLDYVGSSARIIGTVTRSDTGEPVSSNFRYFGVDVYDGAGNGLGGTGTNVAGQYQLFLDAGDYLLSTSHDVDFHNLINEAWTGAGGVPCFNDCNPANIGGDLINAPAGGTAIADFVLDPAAVISGTVTDEVTSEPLQGITMCLAPQAGGNWFSCRNTDAEGNYAFKGLEVRADYIPFVWSVNGQGYARETWNDQPCCNGNWIGEGTPVSVSSGGTFDADFALAPSAAITGILTDSATGTPVSGGSVWLVTPQCGFLERGITDDTGRYTLSGFEPGTYYVAANADNQGYVRQLYPDIKRYDSCDPDVADGQAIPVDPLALISNIDFALDMGGSISGYISDAGGVLPQFNGDVRLFDVSGKPAGFNFNREPDNGYRVGGLLPGTYTVLLTGRNLGLIDERYDDVPCPRNSCDPALGVPVVVGPEENITGIDATLSAGARLSGQVTDEFGAPLDGYFVNFYTEDGLYAGFGSTDANGEFTTSSGYPDGVYLMSNQWFPTPSDPQPVQGGYLPQVWKNDGSFGDCGDPCNLLLGDPITVSGGADVGGLNLALATGQTLFGQVTTGATPLQGVELRLLSSQDGSLVRSQTTDAGGNYAFEGLPSTGEYYLRTLNTDGYGDLLYDSPANDSCNPSCDPLQGGLILMASGPVSIGFDLVPTPVIQGNVSLPNGDPATGTTVKAYNSLGSVVATTLTNASGDYVLANLWSGTFYVRTHNTAGYLDDLHSGLECGAACDALDGAPINLTPSGESGINLQLRSAAVISGVVTNDGVVLPGVTVELYRDTGAFVKSTISNGAGTFSLNGLSAGNYHVVSRNSFGYVDEGAGGETCQSTCAPTSTSVVNVPANANVPVNFELAYGGEILGNVQGDGLPLVGVTIRAYNSGGDQIASTTTDAGGDYLIGGLVGGNVYLRTANAAPYRNQRFDGLVCDAFCEVLAGTAVPVTLGSQSSGIDFTLEAGFAISGMVTNAGTGSGIPGVRVDAFDGAGLLAGTAVALTGGAFEIDGLPDGDYRLKTTNALGYIDRVLGGDTCTPEPCEIGSGSLNVVSGADITGVNVALVTGSTTGGYVTDTESNPLQTGSAWLYSSTSAFLKSAAINDGLFSFSGIADGSYYLLVKNDVGLVDQLWANIDCPNGSCDFTTGTELLVGAAPSEPALSVQAYRPKAKLMAEPEAGSRVRFDLQRGTPISGNVSTENGDAVQFANVYIFNTEGEVAAVAVTDGLGDFETESGLPDGDWYIATQAPGQPGAGNGLIDEVFDDLQCLGDCDPVGLGTVVTTPDPVTVNIVLAGGDAPITGTVTAVADATPLGQVTIEVFDDLGVMVKQTSTNGSGEYTVEGLPGGEYTLVARATAGNYGAVLFDGMYCDGGCDVLAGLPVAVGGIADFALPDDNCPNWDNPDQIDSDGDGRGDACELPDVSSKANVDPSAQLGLGVIVSQGASVGANTRIGRASTIARNSDIGASCVIGEQVSISQDVTIGDACEIGDYTTIDRNSVLGDNVTIGSHVVIGRGADIGTGAYIGDNATLGRNITIPAGACIADGAEIGKNKDLEDNYCN